MEPKESEEPEKEANVEEEEDKEIERPEEGVAPLVGNGEFSLARRTNPGKIQSPFFKREQSVRKERKDAAHGILSVKAQTKKPARLQSPFFQKDREEEEEEKEIESSEERVAPIVGNKGDFSAARRTNPGKIQSPFFQREQSVRKEREDAAHGKLFVKAPTNKPGRLQSPFFQGDQEQHVEKKSSERPVELVDTKSFASNPFLMKDKSKQSEQPADIKKEKEERTMFV